MLVSITEEMDNLQCRNRTKYKIFALNRDLVEPESVGIHPDTEPVLEDSYVAHFKDEPDQHVYDKSGVIPYYLEGTVYYFNHQQYVDPCYKNGLLLFLKPKTSSRMLGIKLVLPLLELFFFCRLENKNQLNRKKKEKTCMF